jgi:hypothetical protein
MCSRKMAARIAEIENDAEQSRTRSSKLEKERNRLQVQINEIMVEFESVSIRHWQESIAKL